MSLRSTLSLLALLGSALLVSGVHANPDVIDPLGTPVSAGTGRTVKIDISTRFINVEHLETLTIENRLGQSFSWRFNTAYAPTGYPLKSIAPARFEAGDTWVYVRPPGALRIGQFADPERLNDLKHRLRISAAQEQAWTAYATELRQTAVTLRATRDTVRAMSQQDIQVRRQKATESVRQAANALLPSLDDAQKAEAVSLLPGL